MIGTAYAALAAAGAPALRWMLRARARRGKEIAARLPERWGEDATPRPPGTLIWLHGASVGEAASILPVLPLLTVRATVLVTTGTVTSAALLGSRVAEMRLASRVLHRFVPLDVPRWVERFLDHWRPDAAGFIESEIWPNLLAACRARRIPTMLLNGRLSARSARAWQRWPAFARQQFSGFDVVQAQSAADAGRLAALGAAAVTAPGNLKFAAATLPVDAAELARLDTLLAGRPRWLAASTHPGEEAHIVAAHAALAARFPDLLTIIAPRHPARGAAVAGLCQSWRHGRRSQGENPPAPSGLWIADTLGELGLFYRLAPVVFMGGSLVPHGGQNPLEPARLGAAVLIGPHHANFAEVVATLRAAGGLDVLGNPGELRERVATLLDDPARRVAVGRAGAAAASRHDADLPRRVAASLLALAEAD